MPLDRLSEFIAQSARAESANLPPGVVHSAKRCIIDWFAATIPGGMVPPATMLAEAFGDELDRGGAMLLPSGRRASPGMAALINGAASHVLEFDDIFRDAIYHPGAPVISAALAMAQADGADGARFLGSVVAGYEVSTRIGVAMLPAHYDFWHPTGTVGSLGAAAACSAILNLDPAQAAHALANAADMAAGLQQAFRSDSMAKPFHTGRAAECGVLVARAARAGVTGARGMLDGDRGFGAAMSRDVDWATATEGLGSRYNITAMSQKNHACCGHVFAAVDATLSLMAEHRLKPDDVARISVGTFAMALEVAGFADPRTAFEAKFSLAYCVSAAAVTGRVRLAAFAPERLADPAIRALMQRIEIAVDTQADAAFPNQRTAVVEIETGDGARPRHHAATRKGDPDDPLSDDELVDKYTELVAPVIGDQAAAALLEYLWRIETADDMAALPVNLAEQDRAEFGAGAGEAKDRKRAHHEAR